jgi:Ala-tRNA(Pro) deacylase
MEQEGSMESTDATNVGGRQELVNWLESQHVDYQLHEHGLSFTARETAHAEGVDPTTFAKVVAVKTGDGRRALVILEATDHLDLRKTRDILETSDVRLLTEDDLDELAPECETGALPAVGQLFGIQTYADYALRDAREISFNAGTHRLAIRVDREQWARAAGVVYGDLAEDIDRRPAWFRS